MTKGSIMEKNKYIIILNIYVPNKNIKIYEGKLIKQTNLLTELQSSTTPSQ